MKNSTKSVQSRICSGFAKRRIKRSAAEGKANWGPTAKARILSLFTILMMALTAQAEEVKYLYLYVNPWEPLDRHWEERICTEHEVISADNTPPVSDNTIALGETDNEKWYVVDGEVEINDRITVSGTVHLILKDGASLKAKKGITVFSRQNLYIYAQSTGDDMGKLIATGEAGHAGIGGPTSSKGGSVYIHGGNITATGGSDAAGIGGSLHGTLDLVRIYGGNITAKGGSNAPGIGVGHDPGTNDVGGVTIYNGNITAEGGTGAAGIGGDNVDGQTMTGRNSHGTPSIFIDGLTATVTANGKGGGAGIGGGNGAPCGYISIYGGYVTASSDTGAAIGNGHGGGYNSNWSEQPYLRIQAGTLRATVTSPNNSGAAIGNGGGDDTNGIANNNFVFYELLTILWGTSITTFDDVKNNTDCKDVLIVNIYGDGNGWYPYTIDYYDGLKVYAEHDEFKNPDNNKPTYIRIENDITIGDEISIPKSTYITGNKTISIDTSAGSAGLSMEEGSGASITIAGPTIVNDYEHRLMGSATGKVTLSSGKVGYIQSNGPFSMTGGEVGLAVCEGDGEISGGTVGAVVLSSTSVLKITNGTFEGFAWGGNNNIFNKDDNDNSTITITGGKFAKNAITEDELKGYVPDGYVVTESGNYYVVGPAKVTSITFPQPGGTMTVGEEKTLTPTISADDGADETVEWESSDESVATVDENGKVTALSEGTTIITVTATNGTADTSDDITATYTLTVSNKKPLQNWWIQIQGSNWIYTGREIRPAIVVNDGERTLVENTDYTVAYTNNINVGRATVTITAVEDSRYSGTARQTFTIKANKTALGDAIIGAEEYYEDIKDSNPDTADKLQDAIDDAYEVWNDPNATQQQTDDATKTLNDAVNAARADVALKRITLVIPAKSYVARVDADKRRMEYAVEGVSLHTVKSANSRQVELTAALSVIAAEMPYLIYNDNDVDKEVSLVVSSSDADKVTYDSEHFKGTLESKAFAAADLQTADYYVLINGMDFVWVKKPGTLAAGNCWIELPASAAHARALGIAGEDGPSGIGTAETAAGNDGNWYDLQGRRVAKPARGLYVRDGKKIVVK